MHVLKILRQKCFPMNGLSLSAVLAQSAVSLSDLICLRVVEDDTYRRSVSIFGSWKSFKKTVKSMWAPTLPVLETCMSELIFEVKSSYLILKEGTCLKTGKEKRSDVYGWSGYSAFTTVIQFDDFCMVT